MSATPRSSPLGGKHVFVAAVFLLLALWPLVSGAYGADLVAKLMIYAILAVALELLGHPVPGELRGAPLDEFWDWAIASWSMACVPAVRSLPQPGSAS